jgi:hypothetical protein
LQVLEGKPEGKRPLGRPRRRWEVGIWMDLGEIGLGECGLDSTSSGQRPVAGCCECGDEPSGSCATELVGLLCKYMATFIKAVVEFSITLINSNHKLAVIVACSLTFSSKRQDWLVPALGKMIHLLCYHTWRLAQTATSSSS